MIVLGRRVSGQSVSNCLSLLFLIEDCCQLEISVSLRKMIKPIWLKKKKGSFCVVVSIVVLCNNPFSFNLSRNIVALQVERVVERVPCRG